MRPHPWDSPGKNTGVGCHFLLQCLKVKSESEVAQSCLDYSRPHGLQPTRLLRPWDFPGKSTWVGCHCLLRCNFLNPIKTITSETCSTTRWGVLKPAVPAASTVHQKRTQFCATTPDCTSHNQHFKSWTNWAMKFCLICHIHLTSHQPSLLQASQQLFTEKMIPQPAGGRRCFPRVLRILKHRFLGNGNKTCFSLAKMCWL